MLSLLEVKELSKQYNVIPIVESLFSGSETPLGIFEKLAGSNKGSFLLESAEQGVWSRYSFIGVSNLGVISKTGTQIRWEQSEACSASDLLESLVEGNQGLTTLEKVQSSFKAAIVPDLPPLVSGMVGFLGWNTVSEIEDMPSQKHGSYQIPDMAFAVLRDLVVLDHLDSSIKIISNIYLDLNSDLEAEYGLALSRIASLRNGLLKIQIPFIAESSASVSKPPARNISDSQFMLMVEQAKLRVQAGDVFQVVVSQRFEMEVLSSALDLYRALRALNPSPYMYLMNFEDSDGAYSIIGSSPEALVKVTKDQAVLHPIAGSRPRGLNSDEDASHTESLRADQKEQAEHLMLVDLARNDLLKVCVPSSVAVTEFMAVEKYSHIMHLVSTVEGTIRPGVSAVGVVRACFPAGTLSGAPKPMALTIIHDLEPSNRGLFGGVVGYFDFSGNADLAIAIRTIVMRNGKGFVQAGAGIVLDSSAESENQETLAKASAPLRAIALANSMRRLN